MYADSNDELLNEELHRLLSQEPFIRELPSAFNYKFKKY